MYETNITKLTNGQRMLFAGICAISKRDHSRVIIIEEEKVKEVAGKRDVIQTFLSLRYKKNISLTDTADINVFAEVRSYYDTGEVAFVFTDGFYSILSTTPYDELEEYMSLTGKYAHNLYKLLTRMKNSGYKIYDLKDFRVLMGIPESYDVSELTRTVVRPAVRNLRRIKDFEDLDFSYVTKKKKAEKIIFEWKEHL